MNRREFVQTLTGTATLAALGTRARAADTMATARILVGFSAGGGSDTLARRVADKMRGVYANLVLVDNRPGAGGQIAVSQLKDSNPDGSTLLLTPASILVLYPHTYSKLPYNSFEDTVPVSVGCYFPFGFGVGPAVPDGVHNIADFLAWAKAHPDKATYASPGAGSMPHMVAALLERASGVPMTHVPYRGSAPGIADLLGGQVASMSSPLGDYLPQVKTGRLRLLAVSGQRRSPFAPNTATYAEQGYSELTMREWFGFFLPRRAKPETVQRAFQGLKQALSQPDLVEGLAGLGFEVSPSASPEAFARQMKAEHDLWAPFVKRVGFTADS